MRVERINPNEDVFKANVKDDFANTIDMIIGQQWKEYEPKDEAGNGIYYAYRKKEVKGITTVGEATALLKYFCVRASSSPSTMAASSTEQHGRPCAVALIIAVVTLRTAMEFAAENGRQDIAKECEARSVEADAAKLCCSMLY